MGKSEHEEHDGFSYRANDPGGRDKDSDSVFGAGFQIDVVIANAATPNSAQARNSSRDCAVTLGFSEISTS